MSANLLTVEIPLPYVCGYAPGENLEAPDGSVLYDDSVDVYVEPTKDGQPWANLRLSPGGPADFLLSGFDTAGLRKLAAFLVTAADAVDADVKRYRENG